MSDKHGVDEKLTDANVFSDQVAVYEPFTQMRRDDPVHWTVRDDGVGFWSLFKHADCTASAGQTDPQGRLGAAVIDVA